MPFTTSHPAIILPLKRLWPTYFSLTGLIAGAMSPDLIYFITLTTIERGTTHSWGGFLTFCLPVGLLFAIAVQKLFKYQIISNLPGSLDLRLSGLAYSSWKLDSFKRWIVLISSVLIGTLSHYFLDSFTHEGGQSVALLPFLETMVSIGDYQRHLYRILQHTFSLVGGIIMILYFLNPVNLPTPVENYQAKSNRSKIKFWIWGAVFSTCFALAAVWVFKTFMPQYLVQPVATFGLGGFAGFFYYCCLLTIFGKKVHLKK